jgi:endo-1,4-beta-xylanase
MRRTIAIVTTALTAFAPQGASAAPTADISTKNIGTVRLSAKALTPNASAANRGVARAGKPITVKLKTRRVNKITVTAQAVSCKTARMTVKITGKRVINRQLTAKAMRTSTRRSLDVRPGTHRLQISASGRGCGVKVKMVTVQQADGRRIPLGVAVSLPNLMNDAKLRALVQRHADIITPENEMKWGVLEREYGTYEWAGADMLVQWARAIGAKIHGHALIYDQQLPGWLTAPELDEWWTPERVSQEMRRHITAVMGRYKGTIRRWDVVNEAVEPDGSLTPSLFLRKLGPHYIEQAYRIAHEADPKALLFYNDLGIEGDSPHTRAVYRIVKNLKRRGVPIHGVGFQSHLVAKPGHHPTYEDLRNTLQKFADLGLRVEISELDVDVRGANRNQQAEVYRLVARACAAVKRCTRFGIWGLTDRYTWLAKGANPLPFDFNFRPKPAWTALRQELYGPGR